MRDFTLDMYSLLLETAKAAGYRLISFHSFATQPQLGKTMVLRHDVDARPLNSLATAELENKMGAHGTYYFRCVRGSFDPETILKIKNLGHEIGYHYEDLALCGGDIDEAYSHFTAQLGRFRKLVPIETICMHGSPLSRWDNRAIWKKYNYRELAIIAEPYFDTDFTKVLYLTDTGRSWNYSAVSVRDKVEGLSLSVNNTEELISLFRQKKLPDQIMLNIHPQRWTNNLWLWNYELLTQSAKNLVKKAIVR